MTEPMADDEIPLEPAPAEEASGHGKIEGLQNELDKVKDQLLRTLAETDNVRKRAQKDREDASRYAVSSFAKDLISVADNLRRALDSVPGDLIAAEPRLKNLVDGIEATEREMLKSFEKHGIRKINPDGELFNPNYHEVMFEAHSPGKPAGTIVQVIEAGYILNDRLLRPARVGVAKNDGQGDGSPGAQIDTQA